MAMGSIFVASELLVVLIGMVIMTQLLSGDQLASGIWRVLWVLLIGILALVLSKSVMLPILKCGLLELRRIVRWFAVAVLACMLSLISIHLLIAKLSKWRVTKQKQTKEDVWP